MESHGAYEVVCDLLRTERFDEVVETIGRQVSGLSTDQWKGVLRLIDEACGRHPNVSLVLTGKCIALVRLGRHDDGLRASERAIELDPRCSSALRWKGHALVGLKRFDAALLAFDEVIESNPRDGRPWTGRGDALNGLGRHDEALSAYDRAIELGPSVSSPWIGRNNALRSLQRFDDALAASEKAIELDPDAATGWLAKGGTLVVLERHEEGRLALDRSIELDPRFSAAWYYKGAAHLRLDCYEEAVSALGRAVELDPTVPWYWFSKAASLRRLGRYEEALRDYERAVELDSGTWKFWHWKGVTLQHLDRHVDAISAFESAIEVEPEELEPWLAMGDSLRTCNRLDEALPAFERAIAIASDSAYAWNGKGSVLIDLRRSEEALIAFERAVEIDPGSAAPWHWAGNALGHLGRHDEALAAFERAIELEPESLAWVGKGNALLDLGRDEEAVATYKRAIEIHPVCSDPWHGWGTALDCVGRHEEALRAYERAIELEPGFGMAWHGKGNAYFHLKRSEDSVVAYERAIELAPASPEPWFGLARSLAATPSPDRPPVLACVSRTLRLEPRRDHDRLMRLTLALAAETCDAPLLVRRLLLHVPGAAVGLRVAPLLRRCLDESAFPAAVIRDALKPAKGGIDQLLIARVNLAYGDAPAALDVLEDRDIDEPYDLATQFHYLAAMMACLEPEDEIDGQLGWIRDLLRCDPPDPLDAEHAYYRGHLWFLLDELKNAYDAFRRADDHRPALFMAWLCASRLELDEEAELRARIIASEVQAQRAGRPGYVVPFDPPRGDPADPESMSLFEHTLDRVDITEAIHELLMTCEDAGDLVYRDVSRRLDASERQIDRQRGAGLNAVEEWEQRVHGWRLRDDAVRRLAEQTRAESEATIAERRAADAAVFEYFDRDAALSGHALEAALADRVFDGAPFVDRRVTTVVETLYAEHRLQAGQAFTLILYVALRGSFDRADLTKRVVLRSLTHSLDVVAATFAMALGAGPFLSLMSAGVFGMTVSEKTGEQVEAWLNRMRQTGDGAFPAYDRFKRELFDHVVEVKALRRVLEGLRGELSA